MDLAISKINAQGDQADEYVYIRVLQNCDVGAYLIADTTYEGEDLVSNKLRNIFWFPDRQVHAGDAVVLRTGEGEDTSVRMKNGGTLHRFYWNLKKAVWNNTGDAAVLMKITDWMFKATPD